MHPPKERKIIVQLLPPVGRFAFLNRCTIRLEQNLSFYTSFYGHNCNYTIPKGFECDGASIPRLFRSIISPYGKCIYAAIVHDHLYQERGRVSDDSAAITSHTRAQCDRTFYELLKGKDAMPKPLAYLMYKSVRLFGWLFWNKQKRN